MNRCLLEVKTFQATPKKKLVGFFITFQWVPLSFHVRVHLSKFFWLSAILQNLFQKCLEACSAQFPISDYKGLGDLHSSRKCCGFEFHKSSFLGCGIILTNLFNFCELCLNRLAGFNLPGDLYCQGILETTYILEVLWFMQAT